jgi:hypothetical protein
MFISKREWDIGTHLGQVCSGGIRKVLAAFSGSTKGYVGKGRI